MFINLPLNQGPITLNYGNTLFATQKREKLEKWFNSKFKNLVIINVNAKKINNDHGFTIENATLLENTSFQNFINLIRSNQIKLSFKFMIIQPNTPDEKFNKRGTGFRATQSTLLKLYEISTKIL